MSDAETKNPPREPVRPTPLPKTPALVRRGAAAMLIAGAVGCGGAEAVPPQSPPPQIPPQQEVVPPQAPPVEPAVSPDAQPPQTPPQTPPP